MIKHMQSPRICMSNKGSFFYGHCYSTDINVFMVRRLFQSNWKKEIKRIIYGLTQIEYWKSFCCILQPHGTFYALKQLCNLTLLKNILVAFPVCWCCRVQNERQHRREKMTSTKVKSYIHTHVVFNMRHNENKSLRALLCYPIASVTFLKWMALFSSVAMKLLINNLINYVIHWSHQECSQFTFFYHRTCTFRYDK